MQFFPVPKIAWTQWISVTTFRCALMTLRPSALELYYTNNCLQWSQLKLHLSKFHDIQEYRMWLQNNFGHNICLLGFSFIPFLHKNCRTRERYAFASCHNCGFSVCNLIIDFLPAQPGELSEICRKPKLYIPSMYYKHSNESCRFLGFLADWAVRAVVKMSAILIKYPKGMGVGGSKNGKILSM